MILDLATYKEIKGLKTANTAQDAQIEALISSVSSLIYTYIGYNFLDFYSTDKTEYFKGDKSTLSVDIYPIKEGSVSVYYLDSTNTYVALVENTDYYVDYENDYIESVSGNAFMAVPRPRAIKVVYRGGYAACPTDIQLAAAELIEFYLKQEKSPTKTLGGAETMTFNPFVQGRLPNHVATVLDMYRVPLK